MDRRFHRGRWIQPDASIFNGNNCLVRVPQPRGYSKVPWPISCGTYRLDTVSDQVDKYLLQLYAVPPHWLLVSKQVDVKHDPTALHFAAKDGNHFHDGVTEIDLGQLDFGLLRKSAQSLDHVGRPLAIAHQARYLHSALP